MNYFANPGKKFVGPHLQNNQSKNELEGYSSGRTPALQVWNTNSNTSPIKIIIDDNNECHA
jgi:hypothetical protein